MDVFGICANSAFEEKMEVEMIYFWKDGEFRFTEFTNMMMMFSTAAVACCKGKAAETEEAQL